MQNAEIYKSKINYWVTIQRFLIFVEFLVVPLYLWASLIAQLVKNPRAIQDTPVQFLVRQIPWRRDRLPTSVFLGFPCGSAGKESACNAEDLGLIPGLGRPLGEGKGYPLHYSGLEKSMDCTGHGVTKSVTTERLSLSLYLRDILTCLDVKLIQYESYYSVFTLSLTLCCEFHFL